MPRRPGRASRSTRRSAPVSASPSRSSADRAPAVSPCARLWAASLSAVPAAPSACEAVASSSASWRASSRCCSGVSSSSLSPRSLRSSRVFSGSPSRFASGLPVAARDSARLSASATRRAARWPDRAGRGRRSRSRRGARGSRRGRPGARAADARGRAAPGRAASADRRRRSPLSSRGPRRPRRSARPAVGCLADLLLLGDHGVLRVREQRDRARAGGPPPGRRRPAGARGAAGTGRQAPCRSSGRASRRWRRTNRSVSAASSSGSDASRRPDLAGRRSRGVREGDRELERARHPVAEPALGVDRERRLAEPRPGPHAGDEPAEQPDERDRRAERPAPTRAARTGRASRGRAPRRRRPRARSSPPDEPAQPQAPAMRDAGRARSRDEVGIERPGQRRPRGSGGTTGRGSRPAPRRDATERAGAGRIRRRPRRVAAPRRRRQRRVGDTNWTDSSRKTTDRTSQATTLFGQNASRRDPERDDVGRHDEPAAARRRRRRPLRRPGASRSGPAERRPAPRRSSTGIGRRRPAVDLDRRRIGSVPV